MQSSTPKSRKRSIIRILQLAYVFETAALALWNFSGIIFLLIVCLQGAFASIKFLMLLVAIVSMIALAAGHFVDRADGEMLWAGTVLHTFFCMATGAEFTGDGLWFMQRPFWVFAILFAFNITLSIVALVIIARRGHRPPVQP